MPNAPRIPAEQATLKTLIVDGRTVAYQDIGTGPTVILAHCSSASHEEWRPVAAELSGRYRVLVPDLVGYGKSDPWPTHARLHPWSDLNVLLGLAAMAQEPVHLGGHSYGGTVALEAARVLGARVASLTLVEPGSFNLLRVTGRVSEWNEISEVGGRVLRALRMRRDRDAAAAFMRYCGGRWAWWLMPPRARRRVVATVGKVAAEFQLLHGLSTSIGDYRHIPASTRLIAGERTRAAIRAIVDVLLHVLPHAHLHVISRAGHMSPFTHPAAVGELFRDHIDACEEMSTRSRRGTTWRRSG